MKCPYCGVHYMDDESVCPVCGKRAGVLAPKKKSKYSNSFRELPYEPHAKAATSSSKKSESSYNSKQANPAKHPPVSSTWQKASGQPYLPSQPQGTSSHASGCLIAAIIIGVILFLSILGANVSLHSFVTDVIEDDTISNFIEDDTVSQECAVTDLLTGTWTTSDGSLSVTIYEDGSLSWSDGANSTDPEIPSCYRLLLTDDNALSWCSEDELQEFPLDQYIHYTLYAEDSSDLLADLDLYLYYPIDQSPDTILQLECYDYETSSYQVLTRSESTTIPVTGNNQTA